MRKCGKRPHVRSNIPPNSVAMLPSFVFFVANYFFFFFEKNTYILFSILQSKSVIVISFCAINNNIFNFYNE